MKICYLKTKSKKNKKYSTLNLTKINFACLLFFLAFCVEISSQKRNLKNIYNENPAQSVSKSITDVINEFYIKNNIELDFIIYGNKTNHINDVINGIKIFPTTLKHISNVNEWDYKLNRSAIFFVSSLTKIDDLHLNSLYLHASLQKQFTNLQSKKLKFIIFIENAESFELVENKFQSIEQQHLLHYFGLYFLEFLIFIDKNKIILAANVYYSEKKCGEIQLQKLNSFDKKSQKWDKKLENFDHFANFHGCIIAFHSFIENHLYIKDFTNLSISNETLADKNVKFAGIINTLLEIVAVKYNFTIHYTIIELKNEFIGTKNYKPTYSFFIHENKEELFGAYQSQPLYLYLYILSYNDFYTNYEKLTFPFDSITWILIFLVFGLTFGAIIGLQFCPNWLKTIIFGEGINNPAYNALGIFFGISQMQLAQEFFGRTIFIIYIWFCLIIRTCWQSMMFECITNDMRKPMPETIEDLINMDYKVLALDRNLYYEILNNRDGPEIKNQTDFDDYKLFYEAALNGDTKSKYAFFASAYLHAILNSTFKDSLPIMKNERMTKKTHIYMVKQNVLTQAIDERINELMPSGILQHESDYGMWYLHRPVDVEIPDSRRILAMSDLEFGFVIFLGFLGLAIVVFICELHALYVRRELKKLLGLYEFMRVIRERLRDYHDRW
ncbi:hypothetical protein PVAND_015547 [Polypedilum vanderplanki]|uniref:Ionotropic receptor n=1 Tax=Polypedilum vanderplanki TaxID=319348 RepID=A0A9J6BCY5_POLVA|nr:hypothetical protein PVAND_015547 [Polypedilum vanderplanki]